MVLDIAGFLSKWTRRIGTWARRSGQVTLAGTQITLIGDISII